MTEGQLDPDIFFLSVAETNNVEDTLVAKFYARLRDEVRAQAGIGRRHPARTGFLSISSLRLGADWSTEIRAALGNCAVFVALTSPVYFASSSCGREWAAFSERLREHQRRTGHVAPVLLPVCWRKAETPAVAASIQYSDRHLSARVHEHGLHAVMRDGRWRDDYRAFVTALAELILRLATEQRVTPLLPDADFDSLPAAFPAVGTGVAPAGPTDATLQAGRSAKRRRSSRGGAPARLRIVLGCATIDRVWADWIQQEVTRLGHDCALFTVDADASALAGADSVAVLLSDDDPRIGDLDRRWSAALDRSGRSVDLIVRIRVRGASSRDTRAAVDLSGLTADAAIRVVCLALGIRYRPDRPVGDATADSGAVRFPGEVARIWRAPAFGGAAFVGREDVIDWLRNQLSDQPGCVALLGDSGVGKTAIAREYAHRFAASYDIVWWVSATNEDNVRFGLEELGTELNLPLVHDSAGGAERVLAALRSNRTLSRWLLVMDDAAGYTHLARYMPVAAGATILTSQQASWESHLRSRTISVFDRAESIALITRHTSGRDEHEVNTLAERLGDLPAAIELSACWLATTGGTVQEYIELLAEGDPVDGLVAPAHAAFAAAVATLRTRSAAAARLIELLATLAPRPIPVVVLHARRLGAILGGSDAPRDPVWLDRLAEIAGELGLVRVDPSSGTISMHATTHKVIVQNLAPGAREAARTTIIEVLAEINPGDADNAENWPLYESLRPHVAELRAAEEFSSGARRLVIDVVRYLRMRGRASACEQLAEHALAAWGAVADDPDDIDTMLLRFHYANVVRDFGKLEQAYEIDRDLLYRLTRIVGEHHPYTLMVAGSYAQDLREQGRWAEAQRREEQTFARIRPVLGEDHPRALMAATNYALTLRLASRYGEASEIDRRTYAKRRRLLGEEHPFTLSSADVLGTDERELGELPASRHRLEAVYGASRRVLGEEHPQTLFTMRNLATTCRWLGDTDAAATLLDVALPRLERVLGVEHPAAIGCRVERANVLFDQGDYSAALLLAGSAERSYQALFEPDHPLCLAARNNVAVLTRTAGDPLRGKALANEVAAGFAAKLGEGHAITALALVNLANAAAALDDLGLARQIDERAYNVLRAVLRPRSVAAIAARLNYALGRFGARDYDESFWSSTVRHAEDVLGRDHPVAAHGRGRHRIDLTIEPFVM